MRFEAEDYSLDRAEEIESEMEEHINNVYDGIENIGEAEALYNFVEEKRGELDEMVDELRGRVADIADVFERTEKLETKVQDKFYELEEQEPKFKVGDTVKRKDFELFHTVLDVLTTVKDDGTHEHAYMLRLQAPIPTWIAVSERFLTYA